MVELRKRKAPPPPPPPAKKKATPKTKAKVAAKAEPKAKATKEDAPAPEIQVPESNPDAPKMLLGYTVDLEKFGGEVQTNDEKKVTLAQLVEESKAGVVLFTYPKASTPGCTTQVCLFRDDYTPLTATGLSIYGLSNDSPKSNTTFKTKQNLPYTLLCDPSLTLIEAIGMKKTPKGTTRGVFVIDKSGKVLAKEAGGPAATVEVVKRIVKEMGGANVNGAAKAEDKAVAETAAEVADSAATLDKSKQATPLPAA